MSNRIPTRSRVPISASKANKFDLSSRHIGTTNFGELKPIYCESVIPSDRFSLDVQSFTRLDPMPAPSMAEMFVHTRCFFVPYNTILHGSYHSKRHDLPYTHCIVVNNQKQYHSRGEVGH